MPFLILIGIAGVGLFLFSQSASGADAMIGGTDKRLFNLPDIEPENQGGKWSREFDLTFEKVADDVRVPFALLKAHAVQESAFDPWALRREPATSTRPPSASYGLMQLLWWPGSERWKKYGYSDSDVGLDGGSLYDPEINIYIAARLIADNLKACGGNVKDAINMYNTGVKFSQRQAPGQYTEKVLSYYSTISRREIT